jgi:dipeptidyl-peptidase-3
LHECLGHASGQSLPGVTAKSLKNYHSTIEEARADLFGLYYLPDKKMVELNLIPDSIAPHAEYIKYIRNGLLTQLTRIEPGKNIEEAHMRNRQMIAQWCYQKGLPEKVIEQIVKNNKTYIRINDFSKLRKLFGQLLTEVQRITSEGDYLAAQKLVETYGVKVDPVLHREILERYKKLDLAPYSGFINPVFHTVEKDGKIVDVTIEYPSDFTSQMLKYSHVYSFLPNRLIQ